MKYEISKPQVNERDGTIKWCEGWDITDSHAGKSFLDDWNDRLRWFIVQTKEQNIREGLIKLGWTPPKAE